MNWAPSETGIGVEVGDGVGLGEGLGGGVGDGEGAGPIVRGLLIVIETPWTFVAVALIP